MLRPNTAQKGDELAGVTCNRTSVLAATPNDTGHGKRRIDDGGMSNERDGVTWEDEFVAATPLRDKKKEDCRCLKAALVTPSGRIERAVKMPTKRYV